jgi:uncharacterized membrane protein YjjP (DUF1212 family)
MLNEHMTLQHKLWTVVGIFGFLSSAIELLSGGGLWHLFFTACNIFVIYERVCIAKATRRNCQTQ